MYLSTFILHMRNNVNAHASSLLFQAGWRMFPCSKANEKAINESLNNH